MRVLLVHPPLNTSREVTPPLGLCTLASWLRHEGHELKIIDLDFEIKAHPDGEGACDSLLERALRDFSPRAVGITSMYNNSLQAERVARRVKEVDDSMVTIGGGSHFGALGCQSLRRLPEMDYVIEGEGELAFSGLLAALASGAPVTSIPRLHYRAGGELCQNAAAGLMDLSALPPMWLTLDGILDLKRYAGTVAEGSQRRTIYIEAGRGCPFACSFCATAPFWERKYRVKPVDRLVEEIRFLHEEHGYNGFMLVHDLLTVDKQFIHALCDAMIECRLPVEWMANHRTDIDLHGLLPKMKAAGCWAMFFGIESASPRLQKEMRKHLTREGVISTIASLSDTGIASTCSFVIGFPSETREELSSTIAMGAELKLIGAGMVQFHRLRTWPPAPLSRTRLPSEFDPDSLRIEYPFVDVPPEDMTIIQGDRDFFAGYFAPSSEAGSFAQMAQVELFFTHAIAAAPLTIAVAGRLMGAGLIDSFYRTLDRRGGITRKQIEADTSSLLPPWLVLKPFLEEWVNADSSLENWQLELLRSVILYEHRRLRFLNDDSTSTQGMAASGENWICFVSQADIGAVFEAMHAGQPLTPELVRESAVVLLCQQPNSYRAYSAEVARLEELHSHPLLQ